MSEYGILDSTFWTRGTGVKLRGLPEIQVVALYLTSAPTANMIGLYYLPLATIAHDTGIPPQGVRKALAALIGHGFCEYDLDAETIFVLTMARRRLHVDESRPMRAAPPKPDHRHAKVVRLAQDCGSVPLVKSFWNTYHDVLSLPEPWWEESEIRSGSGTETDQIQQQNIARAQEPLPSPSQAPSEGLMRSIGAPSDLLLGSMKGTLGKRKKTPTELPHDWSPSKTLRDYAQKLGRDPDRIVEIMRAWAESRGETRISWDGTFRTFALKAEERGESALTGSSTSSRAVKQTEIILAPSPDALPPVEQAEQAKILKHRLSSIGLGIDGEGP